MTGAWIKIFANSSKNWPKKFIVWVWVVKSVGLAHVGSIPAAWWNHFLGILTSRRLRRSIAMSYTGPFRGANFVFVLLYRQTKNNLSFCYILPMIWQDLWSLFSKMMTSLSCKRSCPVNRNVRHLSFLVAPILFFALLSRLTRLNSIIWAFVTHG